MSASGSLSTRSGASLGAVFLATVAALSVPTVLSLPVPETDVQWSLVGLVVLAVAGVASLRLPWERWPAPALLAWPAVAAIGLGLGGVLAPGQSLATLPGVFVLCFLYVGVTQRTWTSCLVVAPSLICWVGCWGGWSHALLLRLSIAVGTWLIVAETVAQLRAQVAKLTTTLQRQASTDVLTGLSTRRTLDEHLDQLSPGDAVVFIDLDHFKAINDRDGHAAGDVVLADMGATVRLMVRDEDLAVRFGGEELLLVLRRSGVAGAYATLRRIEEHWRSLQPAVTFSAGIAVMADGDEPDGVLHAADHAVYAAKAAGRNCWKLDPASRNGIVPVSPTR